LRFYHTVNLRFAIPRVGKLLDACRLSWVASVATDSPLLRAISIIESNEMIESIESNELIELIESIESFSDSLLNFRAFLATLWAAIAK
jgi:hypothetical protein